MKKTIYAILGVLLLTTIAIGGGILFGYLSEKVKIRNSGITNLPNITNLDSAITLTSTPPDYFIPTSSSMAAPTSTNYSILDFKNKTITINYNVDGKKQSITKQLSEIDCSNAVHYVCGQDEKTYLNPCLAIKAGVEIAGIGRCK